MCALLKCGGFTWTKVCGGFLYPKQYLAAALERAGIVVAVDDATALFTAGNARDIAACPEQTAIDTSGPMWHPGAIASL